MSSFLCKNAFGELASLLRQDFRVYRRGWIIGAIVHCFALDFARQGLWGTASVYFPFFMVPGSSVKSLGSSWGFYCWEKWILRFGCVSGEFWWKFVPSRVRIRGGRWDGLGEWGFATFDLWGRAKFFVAVGNYFSSGSGTIGFNCRILRE